MQGSYNSRGDAILINVKLDAIIAVNQCQLISMSGLEYRVITLITRHFSIKCQMISIIAHFHLNRCSSLASLEIVKLDIKQKVPFPALVPD